MPPKLAVMLPRMNSGCRDIGVIDQIASGIETFSQYRSLPASHHFKEFTLLNGKIAISN